MGEVTETDEPPLEGRKVRVGNPRLRGGDPLPLAPRLRWPSAGQPLKMPVIPAIGDGGMHLQGDNVPWRFLIPCSAHDVQVGIPGSEPCATKTGEPGIDLALIR